MADVRFSILCGPPSLDPAPLGFPPVQPLDPLADAPDRAAPSRAQRVVLRRRSGVIDELTTAYGGWWYAWRLMASNNRRLARGLNSFGSRLSAVDAINQLRDRITEVRPHITTDPQNGSWGWRAEDAGRPLATCPHWYERERDCRTGFAKFVDAVARAQIAEGGVILRESRGSAPSAISTASAGNTVSTVNTTTIEESRRWPA